MAVYSSERGFSILSVLLALLIIGLLYLWLVGWAPTGIGPSPESQVVRKASQDLACRLNQQAIDREILTWTATHPGDSVTLDKLRRNGVYVPDCPDGGRLSIQGNRATCSTHKPAHP